MPDFLTADFLRGIIAVEMLLLAGVAVFRQTVQGADDSKSRRRWEWSRTWVLLVVVAGVVLNMIAPIPISPGAVVVAVGSLPTTIHGVVFIVRTVRQHRAYSRLVEHLSHAEPCATPDCINARAELARIRDL